MSSINGLEYLVFSCKHCCYYQEENNWCDMMDFETKQDNKGCEYYLNKEENEDDK